MTPSRLQSCNHALRKLQFFNKISAADIALIRKSATIAQRFNVGAILQYESEDIVSPKVIVSGWACRLHMLPDGRRQIYCFLLPGDSLGIREAPNTAVARSSIMAATPLRVFDAREIESALRPPTAHPELALAFDRAAELELAIIYSQIVRIGRLSAYERAAHLFCELSYRLGLAGLTNGSGFALPITQAMLADSLGLSAVHANRILTQLRRDKLLEIENGHVCIKDSNTLCDISGFRPPFPADSAGGAEALAEAASG